MNKPIDIPSTILLEPDLNLKRSMLQQWITNPDNQVKIIVAFSGGKDSVCMVLYLLFELQVPARQIELHHHDVDGHGENLFDWACTPSYCQAFADHFNLPLYFSYREGGIVREIYRTNETSQDVLYQADPGGQYTRLSSQQLDRFKSTRRKFPAVTANLRQRWCSGAVKIDVLRKVINNRADLKNANVVICTGERRVESANRNKYSEIEKHHCNNNSRNVIAWRCIIDWSDEHIWTTMEQHRIQCHPCYELGWGRASCQICIFNSANTWVACTEISPEKPKRIAAIETDIDFTLYSKKVKGKTVNQDIYTARVKAGKSFLTPELKAKWAVQATDKFTAPIIVTGQWRRPLGANARESCGSL